jgi:hypothetical protein
MPRAFVLVNAELGDAGVAEEESAEETEDAEFE